MARQPRTPIERAVYHVTCRAVARQAMFRDADDCRVFLMLLWDAVRKEEWNVHAYCLMSTHFHLLVRSPSGDLSRGMQRLNGCYAQRFNRRHGELGHRFFRRYAGLHVEGDAYLLELVRYLALNPVRAGACRRPSEWIWSSYPAMLGLTPAPAFLAVDWLLGLFGADAVTARARLREFVEGVSVE